MKSASAAGAHRERKTYYVDIVLQKWLLVALVIMETVLVSVAVWLLHWRLNLIIEENLYSAHIVSVASMLEQLRNEALMVLALFVSVNAIALLIADVVWYRYVFSVLRGFMTLVGKTSRLDFSGDLDNSHHELHTLAATWRAQERDRLGAIREHLAQLDSDLAGENRSQSASKTLDALKELLPVAPVGQQSIKKT